LPRVAVEARRLKGVELGFEDLAKYPFLKEAGEYVRQLDLELEALTNPQLEVVQRARERVLQAATRRPPAQDRPFKPEVELLSFPLALLLVRATGIDTLANYFAHNEAIRTERFLEEEREPLLLYILREVFHVDVAPAERAGWSAPYEYRIHFADYLARATAIHEPAWKLVNRMVVRGYVYLRRRELVRLVREEVRHLIYRRIKALQAPRLPEALKPLVEEVVKAMPRVQPRRGFRPEKYPPCVEKALELMRRGENVPHYGRLLLTTYLLHTGMGVEEVIGLFAQVPDFNERITRYQVEHLAGLRGGRKKYMVPGCRSLQTHSFCFKTAECDDISNPLQFGRRRRGEKRRAQGK
jgi:DNA primase large subunit